MSPPGTKLVASNRKARRDYAVLETMEAGLVLVGSEVKSLRSGHVQLADAYARIRDGEVWLEGVHIAPYAFAHGVGAHDPDRARKLLLKSGEITKLAARVAQDHLTLVPLSIYFRDGRAKVELALGRGKDVGDKRQSIKEREMKREMDRAGADFRRGR